MRVSTCIFHVQLAESRPLVINNDLSHLGGYMYSIGLVKAVLESLQELVRASSSSMLVTLNNVDTAHLLYGRSIPNTDGTNR